MNENEVDESVSVIARNIGALVGSTSDNEAIALLNEMLITLFRIQDIISTGEES